MPERIKKAYTKLFPDGKRVEKSAICYFAEKRPWLMRVHETGRHVWDQNKWVLDIEKLNITEKSDVNQLS